jgi:hypothetical protein
MPCPHSPPPPRPSHSLILFFDLCLQGPPGPGRPPYSYGGAPYPGYQQRFAGDPRYPPVGGSGDHSSPYPGDIRPNFPPQVSKLVQRIFTNPSFLKGLFLESTWMLRVWGTSTVVMSIADVDLILFIVASKRCACPFLRDVVVVNLSVLFRNWYIVDGRNKVTRLRV